MPYEGRYTEAGVRHASTSMSKLGGRIGPFDTSIDADFVRCYAAATADDNPAYVQAECIPPLAIAARIFEAQMAGMEHLLPRAIRGRFAGGVHGEHDVVLHRPIVAGEELSTFVEFYNARPFKNNLRVAFCHLTLDAAGHTVAEQMWTTILLGVTDDASGPDSADHTFPVEARANLVSEQVVHIDAGMAARYAEVSQDFSAHHFDVEAARRSGYDSVFLHGLCTMGLCAKAAVDTLAGGRPERIRRVAVRFASPAPLEQALCIRIYQAEKAGYAMEAECGATTVIRNGRVELI